MILPFLKKTSESWNKIYRKKYKMLIMDEDGWDRRNFHYSWYVEKITWKEFIKRSIRSSQVPLLEELKG